MSALNRIEEIELEESRKTAQESPENVLLQENKLKYSHPYDKRHLKYFYSQVLRVISSLGCRKLIFLGGGSGNEAAYVRSRLSADHEVILTDLSQLELQHHKKVFKNYSAPFPRGVIACSFHRVPFKKLSGEYCGIAFLCLHHSESMEPIISHLLEIFDQLVILEPMTNSLLDFLAQWGITQRAEGVDYRPSRIHLSFFENLKNEFSVNVKTYFQIPRDYLPFLSHKQKVIFKEEELQGEAILSMWYFRLQFILNKILSLVRFGNLALIHIKRKSSSPPPGQ